MFGIRSCFFSKSWIIVFGLDNLHKRRYLKFYLSPKAFLKILVLSLKSIRITKVHHHKDKEMEKRGKWRISRALTRKIEFK